MSNKVQTIQKTNTGYKKPSMYAVIMHNDDYTTMDFVVEVLVSIFHKSKDEAANIMMEVHQIGKCVVGIYTYDIAVTKKMQTEQYAGQKGFPLHLSISEATS